MFYALKQTQQTKPVCTGLESCLNDALKLSDGSLLAAATGALCFQTTPLTLSCHQACQFNELNPPGKMVWPLRARQ